MNSVLECLEFQYAVLSDRVTLGRMCFPVRLDRPPPLRCYKCQRYGHVAVVCRGNRKRSVEEVAELRSVER